MMNIRFFSFAMALSMAVAADAQAFGINDVLNIGIQAGGKLLGAAVDAGVDKARDAMRDPEAEAAQRRVEERKLAEQFQKQVAEIESMPDLRPLDRERLVLQLEKQYAMATQFQSFVEVAEARQREERDKIFTTAGLVNVIGEAALSAPSVTVARVELLSATGEIQTREAMARLQVEAGGDSMYSQAALDAALTGLHVHQTRDQVAAGMANAREAALNGQSANVAAAMDQAKATAMTAPTIKRPPEAFTADLGRKLFVEFVGSPTETVRLRRVLADQGHVVIDDAGTADVRYRIEGEYTIAATQGREGLSRDVGSLLESPSQVIALPEKTKKSGSLTAGLGRLLMGMAMVEMPNGARNEEMPKQAVLLVASRHPADGRETRASATRTEQSGNIMGASLAASVRDALYEKLGLGSRQEAVSLANSKP